jgi:hypothetical protein
MAERYRGGLQEATPGDVIGEAGERWDCREVTGGYVAVPVPRVDSTPELLLAVIRDGGGPVVTGCGDRSAEAAGEMNVQAPRCNRTIGRSPSRRRRYVRGAAGALAVRSGFLALPYPVARAPPPRGGRSTAWGGGAARRAIGRVSRLGHRGAPVRPGLLVQAARPAGA